jgi:hypothetical protein
MARARWHAWCSSVLSTRSHAKPHNTTLIATRSIGKASASFLEGGAGQATSLRPSQRHSVRCHG